jgi:hypothetical protein
MLMIVGHGMKTRWCVASDVMATSILVFIAALLLILSTFRTTRVDVVPPSKTARLNARKWTKFRKRAAAH